MSLDRRSWLKGLGASAAGLFLSACNRFVSAPSTLDALGAAEGLTRRVQRLIGGRAMAREFGREHISAHFRANGNTRPSGDAYAAHAAAAFADWRLVVDGLVEHPLSLSLAQLQALPARTQITRHDCVEGWSSIAEWTGAKLAPLLQQAGLRPEAQHIVFHCADSWAGGALYYESLDLIDAFHEQTILAYRMNGQPLPVPHGAPLRLRAERHLGYKQAKYIMRIEAVASLAGIGQGKGGYWEDRHYERYAGI
jgi:DMSO/TMAO reductase YedYZ molybdopterin-dependent catalytic subunit